jgi:hypothetical protein
MERWTVVAYPIELLLVLVPLPFVDALEDLLQDEPHPVLAQCLLLQSVFSSEGHHHHCQPTAP